MEIQDAYALLGVEEDAAEAELNACFGLKVAEALQSDDQSMVKKLQKAYELIKQHINDEAKEFKQVIAHLEKSKKSLLIMGKAGSGKSSLLRDLIAEKRDGYAVCASTGVAALNIGVPTLHSLFGFGAKVIGQDDEFFKKYSTDKLEALAKIDTLVIDEISMVNADLIDAIDRLFKKAKKKDSQFGGVQLVMVGDPFQLGPITPKDKKVRDYIESTYDSFWFFDAKAWDYGRDPEKPKFEVFELTKSFRHHPDTKFISVLDNIRTGHAGAQDIEYINENCTNKKARVNRAIKLVTTNADVDRINGDEMEKIKEATVKFTATELSLIAGEKFADDSKGLPAERELALKVGAQVMFVKNDDFGITKMGRRRWANGTTGIVTSFSPDKRKVFVRIGNLVEEVGESTWTKYIYSLVEETDPVTKKKTKALKALEAVQYSQIPLRAAWAITIHKSQGQTYDDVIVDMPKGAFASGQAYVALSRVRQIAGMVLTTPLKLSDVSVDPDAKNMLNRVTIINKPKKK